MIILVINSGSSSLKFQLWDTDKKLLLCKGREERIGLADGIFNYEANGREKIKETRSIPNHKVGTQMVLDQITDPKHGVIGSIKEIEAVGHRIVAGGAQITKSELVTPELEKLIEKSTYVAPLHNPANLIGLRAIKELLPSVPNVGVFDTAFHSTMPEEAFVYPIQWEYYEKHGIRRFGFHGTSHQYVSMRAAEMLGKKVEDFNCITCHMGNGVSLTAVKGGKSVDTSLGFGTLCGVPMGTRCGDVDPAILLYLLDDLKMDVKQVHELLYKNSGFKGVTGLSNDARDIEDAASKGNHRAALALKIFGHYAKKYIGGLATELGGRLDAIIFTAGIGENSPHLRELSCDGLEVLGAKLDKAKNNVKGKEAVISTDDSKVKIMVVPTNEELMIALDTQKIVKEQK